MEYILKNNITKREQEILFYISEGLTNQQIAEKLSISKHTVKAHIERLFNKFNIHNRAGLAVFAFKNKLI